MAAACPIGATDIPGVREVAVDGVIGTLVAPDEPAALADALIEMAQHTDREQLGTAGHQRAKEQFSIQQMSTDTVGCNFVKIFATPGWQNSSREYSRQYDHVTLYQSLMGRSNRGD